MHYRNPISDRVDRHYSIVEAFLRRILIKASLARKIAE